jgi:hypothetical protein
MANLYKSVVFALLVFGPISSIVSLDEDGIYHIGTGIADITGPAAGVVLVRSSPQFLSSLYIHTILLRNNYVGTEILEWLRESTYIGRWSSHEAPCPFLCR